MADNNRSALTGFLLATPFIIANFVVSLHIEPIYSFLASFPAIRNSAFMPLFLLVLFPVGAYIAIRPMLQSQADGKRTWYVSNSIVAVLLIVSFVLILAGFSEDILKCDILRIPNCD